MQNKEFESLACNIRPTLLKTATYIVADGMAAEDVVQDTLLKLWVLRGNLDGYESVEGLALTIARRLALNYLRASNPARFASLSDDDTATLTDSGPSPEDQIISHENEAILGEAISALPPPPADSHPAAPRGRSRLRKHSRSARILKRRCEDSLKPRTPECSKNISFKKLRNPILLPPSLSKN